MQHAQPIDKSLVVRDAATVILLRRDGDGTPRVLMGQRGHSAAFMPSKFVFPGGALDPADRVVAEGVALPGPLASRLEARAAPGIGAALALAAVRELWEETGLALGHRAEPAVAPVAEDSWRSFFGEGYRPRLEGLDFVFRAVTPPGRPRRFDARFFLVEAVELATGPDITGTGDLELSHLNWITLPEARRLDLPFITEVVLAEVEARIEEPDAARPAPFFHHDGGRSFIDAL